MEDKVRADLIKRLKLFLDFKFPSVGRILYPPSQKATDFKAVDECEGGNPSRFVTSVVGYASQGSAL